ncbi:uncharacterized protein CXQ87_001245 [Candidozyma duobushaemuli]|uniref:Uncharacterized protein n=2 Tax=Candidozyma TaxID=3303203 RepID=A0ABX8I1N8_9ASCO|nr:uncharacterized protein CXQ87_001245 [[Candida] duobushaemulonis]PVH18324.1 hypothetical protein CXQ87_001245 [[Candida] duobushaemulonis]QWU86872.1 hypothetical protein CA3LBN_001090 [[Candida] haemuloni]
MKLLGILTITTAVNAAISFNLKSKKDGSDFDNKNVMNRGRLTLGDDAGIDFVLNDDGSLVDGPSKKYINFKSDLAELGDDHLKGFSVKDNKLRYDDKNEWYGCPKDDSALGFKTGCDDKQEIDLELENVKECDNNYPDERDLFFLRAWSTKSDKFQNTPIMKVDEHPHVFSVGGDKGKDLNLYFFDDKGSLADQDNRGVNHDSKTGEVGNVAPFGRSGATPGFSIDGDHLVFEGNDNWRACPSGDDEYSLADNDCTGGTPIVLQVVFF